MKKHTDKLRILLANCPVDVILVNEAKLDNSLQDCEVFIPSYEILRGDIESSGIGAIKLPGSVFSSETLHFIYKALIQPHFDYCNVVWGNCGKRSANKLQKLQNRAARVLTFSNFDANASGLMENLGWDNLKTQRQIQKALMV